MIKSQFSGQGHAVNKRIRNLPEFYGDMINARLLKDVRGFLKTFQDGIANRTLRLTPLKDKTVAAKRRKGMEKPSTPLYGEGLNKDRSLINAFRVQRTKHGYKVVLRNANHHTANISLRTLALVHEFGATITSRTPSGKPFIIRIQPRPAISRSFNKWLQKRAKNDPHIGRAAAQYINKGRSRKKDKLDQENQKDRQNIRFGN